MEITNRKLLSFIIITVFTILSCSGGDMQNENIKYDNLKDIPDAAWEKLSKKSFYFGHQSVGYNILEGVQDIMAENPKITLNIVELNDPKSLKPGSLAHSTVGTNRKPETKIDDFSRHIKNGIGETADAIALKLCYVDIQTDSDPEALFSYYESRINDIRSTYPDLTIIHFTSPLTILQTGPKAWIKKILGRPAWGVEQNVNRHIYNELIRTRYKGKDPILDIAKIESTFPDGTRSSFEFEGKTYYFLAPDYTYDYGHLNELGRKLVAEELILLLANV
jgi:hypothetical protein